MKNNARHLIINQKVERQKKENISDTFFGVHELFQLNENTLLYFDNIKKGKIVDKSATIQLHNYNPEFSNQVKLLQPYEKAIKLLKKIGKKKNLVKKWGAFIRVIEEITISQGNFYNSYGIAVSKQLDIDDYMSILLYIIVNGYYQNLIGDLNIMDTYNPKILKFSNFKDLDLAKNCLSHIELN